MRIVYHHRTRGADAQGIHIRELCGALRELGHEVRVVGPPRLRAARAGGESGARTAGAQLFGRRIPGWAYELLALAYNLPAFVTLAAAILRDRPAMLYERYSLYGVAGRAASALFRVPHVLEVNAPLSLEMRHEDGIRFHRLAQALEDWLFRHATRTIVVSGVMADMLAARGTPRERLCVMPNGVDAARFHAAVDGGDRRRELGLEDSFVVGFVGWIRPWHGVDQLVEAAARLATACPDLRLLVVGDGPAVPELERRAGELGIAGRLTITGAVEPGAVPGYVAAMDVAVQPNVTDYASPIKLFEYLAMGRAVVAPRKANIVEVVGEGEHALLFSPGSVDELAEALRRLHDDAGLRAGLAARAPRLVEARGYYWTANARRVTELVAA